ncbi:hypothetical protein FQZ97_1035820 [compost metagenome]
MPMPSGARTVNSRATRASGTPPSGCISKRASAIRRRTGSRSATARGVGTSLRPARTRIGSPSDSRMRASVWLMAGALRCMRSAAALTLPVLSSASSAASRFRSMEFISCRSLL